VRLQPTLNTLFVPATDWCAPIRKSEAIPDPEIDKRRGLLFGGDFQFDPWADAKGCLTAFDAAAGVRRCVIIPEADNRRVASHRRDLVFAGELSAISCIRRQ